MQVGPCIPVGTQRQKAEAGPTSGPTRRLSHFEDARRDGRVLVQPPQRLRRWASGHAGRRAGQRGPRGQLLDGGAAGRSRLRAAAALVAQSTHRLAVGRRVTQTPLRIFHQ
jgi:hypothetical protein